MSTHIILRAITDFASPVHNQSHSSISINDLPRMFIQTTLFRKYLNYSEARLQRMLSCPLSLFPIFLAPLCGQCCRCRCRAVVLMLLPRHANRAYAHLSTSKSVQCYSCDLGFENWRSGHGTMWFDVHPPDLRKNLGARWHLLKWIMRLRRTSQLSRNSDQHVRSEAIFPWSIQYWYQGKY